MSITDSAAIMEMARLSARSVRTNRGVEHDDLVQDAALRILKAPVETREYRFITGKHAALDHALREVRHYSGRVFAPDDVEDIGGWLGTFQSVEHPGTALLEAEQALQLLSPKQRCAVESSYWLGTSYEEISAAIGVNNDAVKWLLTSAAAVMEKGEKPEYTKGATGLGDRILQALCDAPAASSPTEIGKVLGETPVAVKATCHRLCKAGKIKRICRGKYESCGIVPSKRRPLPPSPIRDWDLAVRVRYLAVTDSVSPHSSRYITYRADAEKNRKRIAKLQASGE
jgi:DNA-directed RNA polymerase specialized sigma24 family protein